MLRLFTVCGSQREVISLPGPVVSVTAHKHKLAVIVHSGSVGKDQCLSCLQMSVVPSAILSRPVNLHPMCLTPNARLRWLGYSEEGSLCSLDEAGLLRKLTPAGLWIPLCNVDSQCKGKSDHQFVVGVNESFQTISCVMCKGAFYPPTTPRPALNEIPWQVPLCDGEGEKTKLEQKLWNLRSAFPALQDSSSSDSVERSLKITILQLFAAACQKGLDSRAYGLCQFMFGDMIDLAVKYAMKQGNSQLAKRIMDMPQAEEEEISEDQPISQDMFASASQESISDNPILALKQRLASSQSDKSGDSDLPEPKPRGNPFKKSSSGKEETGKGLEGIVKQAAEPLPKQKPQILPKENKGQKKISNPGRIKKVISNEDKPKKNVFSKWFSDNKESLEEEFPDLNSIELSKVALKRFREETKVESTKSSTAKQFFEGSSINQENKHQNGNVNSKSNDDVESRKRKTCDEDDDEISPTPELKKPSAASKLKLFSFVKPS